MATEKQKNKPKSQQGFSASMFELMNYEPYLTEEIIKQGIEAHKDVIEKWCYIKHDKDTKENGEPKEIHYHGFIKTKANYNAGTIAGWFKQEIQYINKIKKRFETGALYCIHAHDTGKYQYDPEEVKANFDYYELVERDNNKKTAKAKEQEIADIIVKIENGDIREFNYHNFISVQTYVDYKAEIDKAFQYRRDKISQEDRHQDVIFITGLSGSGKTTFAKDYAKKLNYSCYISSGSNDVLDNYQGQDVLILDDLRPSVMGLSDLLKMLDNNTNSSVKSRYHNKMLECKTIIITSILPIEQFFHNVFSEEEESIVQFKRRCKFYFKFDIEFYEMYIYDSKKRDYRFIDQKTNYVAQKYAPKELTEEDIESEISRVFGDDFIPKENYLVSESKKNEALAPDNAKAPTPFNNGIIPQKGDENNTTEEDIAMFFSC